MSVELPGRTVCDIKTKLKVKIPLIFVCYLFNKAPIADGLQKYFVVSNILLL